MDRICEGNFEFVVYTDTQANLQTLRELGQDAKIIESTWGDKISRLQSRARVSDFLAGKFQLVAPFESRLKAAGIDLVYFVSPSRWGLSLQRIPYITTVLDLCHRDSPEFPEVYSSGRFERRERLYRAILPKAYLILADSELLANRIELRYGVDRDKVLPMPFSPSPLASELEHELGKSVLAKYGLEPDYIFYPAQFWPHKNHYRLLDAVRKLREQGQSRQVVFCGRDKGNLSFIKTVANGLGVGDQVHFLGFVPAEEMAALYKGCNCVCMPSYFGPTNLPPLEAWKFERPLLYPNIYRDQTRDAAQYFDPENTNSLASAITDLDNEETRRVLVKKGKQRLNEIGQDRNKSEKALLGILKSCENRRQCWGRTFSN